MYGKEDTIGRGKCGSMHLGDPNKGHILSSGIVASQIPAATGIAFANKYKNLKNFAVCFFGDGAVDSGGFWESVNLASLFRLPYSLFVRITSGLCIHLNLTEEVIKILKK